MGRPLNKHLFGDNANNNIKVQFYNGTDSVPGFIVRQRSNLKFLCQDANGVQRVCKLVVKDYNLLEAGEMSITVKYDNGTVRHVSKIAKNLVTVAYAGTNIVTGGTHGSSINGQAGWGFSTSTSDSRWQIEEAGTDTSLTSATDLEGDETYNAALDYPVPGTGTYKSGATALTGIAYSAVGTPFAPGGELTSVPNSHVGLRRTKYDGNFCAANNTLPASWVYNFFGTATVIKSIADTYVSWGQQNDGAGTGEHNFSCEWKGYVQAPKSGNFNIYAESDDHCAVWIGTNATSTPSNATRSLAAANQTLPASGAVAGTTVNSNTVTLVAGKWYPIRMWHSEFTGGCKAQLYMQHSDGTDYNGSDLVFAYNDVTKGF
jgi:hypothetical protein